MTKVKLPPMLSKDIQAALNHQVLMEAQSSQAYLAMASWADIQAGLTGVTAYFYQQSDEERAHMLKLIRFINDRGGFAVVPALPQPELTFVSLKRAFEMQWHHEIEVSKSISELVDLTLKEKDFATFNFLQWFVNEQIEEETVAREANEKLDLVGEDKGGLYMFDRDIRWMNMKGGKGKGKKH